MTQFAILVTFYRYHRRMASRTKAPSLRDLGREHNISHVGALRHIEALAYRGYLEQEDVWKHRNWRLTPSGLARAEKRWKLMEKNRKAKEAKERREFIEKRDWRKKFVRKRKGSG